ncbi:MAG: hypothetical protein K6G20_09510 [Ruminococcus sp.]|nr:hypothetical protein [Ruminococcus sp.]
MKTKRISYSAEYIPYGTSIGFAGGILIGVIFFTDVLWGICIGLTIGITMGALIGQHKDNKDVSEGDELL